MKKLSLTALIAVIIVTVMASTAGAASGYYRSVRLNSFSAGINTACPVNSRTQFVIDVRVKPGYTGTFTGVGRARLVRKNGTMLVSTPGYVANDMSGVKVEYLIETGRFARIRLSAVRNRAVLWMTTQGVPLQTNVLRTCLANVA